MNSLSDRVLNFGFDYVLFWPITIARRSKSKFIRLIGLLTWLVWVFPGTFFSFLWLASGTAINMFEYFWLSKIGLDILEWII